MKDLDRMLKDIEMEVELTRHFIGKDSLDERVMAAMKQVPRHHFVPHELRFCAYDNGPVPIGSDQTISQPYIVALMSDLLSTKPDDAILEIGTGSGYQAAVLSHLVRQVYSIEIIEDLAIRASNRLRKLNYNNVEVRCGDGYFGWPEHAPYDGIIVTAAAPNIPKPLLEQLREGARLVLPIGHPFRYQELIVIEKKPDGTLEIREILGVSFVPLTGECDSIAEHHEKPTQPQR
ncbi:MAG: protein-L-isoaspartate(D-aspartate) O-methyltransferase [Gammaproteobacteria bacterium]